MPRIRRRGLKQKVPRRDLPKWHTSVTNSHDIAPPSRRNIPDTAIFTRMISLYLLDNINFTRRTLLKTLSPPIFHLGTSRKIRRMIRMAILISLIPRDGNFGNWRERTYPIVRISNYRVYHVTRGERDTNGAERPYEIPLSSSAILISDFMILLGCVCIQLWNIFCRSHPSFSLPRDPPKAAQWSSLLEGNLPSSRETFYDPERPDKIATVRWISPMASLGKSTKNERRLRFDPRYERVTFIVRFHSRKAIYVMACVRMADGFRG